MCLRLSKVNNGYAATLLKVHLECIHTGPRQAWDGHLWVICMHKWPKTAICTAANPQPLQTAKKDPAPEVLLPAVFWTAGSARGAAWRRGIGTPIMRMPRALHFGLLRDHPHLIAPIMKFNITFKHAARHIMTA